MICSKCGKQLFNNEIICSNCGYNNSPNLNNNVVKNNIENSNVGTNISNDGVQFNNIPVQNNINSEIPTSINYNDNIDNQNVDTNIKSNSHNNIKKKNNILLIILPLVGVMLIGIILFLIFGSSKEKETKELRENTYTMYIKINPLVKLVVKEEYYECTNKAADSAEICSEIKSQVISYNLINQDAKDIYTDIDLNGKDVVEALVLLYDTAVDNDASLGILEVTTDWNNRYSQDELTKVIKEKSKHDGDLQLTIDIKEDIKINEILEKYQIEEKIEITYTVTFNSDGGSKVSEQSVKENEKVEKPTNPTRDGYKFIAWQLNGKNYDFNNEVTSDLELKAKWEKIENTNSKNESQDKNNNTNDNKEDNKQETKPETKVESTLNNINLNDNIKVYEARNGTLCGGYVFSTNVETVFAGYIQNRMIITDVEGYAEKYNQLEFDVTKNQATLSALANLNSQRPAGVSKLEYTSGNQIDFTVYYLIIDNSEEKFTNLSNSLNDSTNVYYSKVDKLFADAYFFGSSGCGMGGNGSIVLTEELCKEYNLTCSRW